ncbi:MAG: radical SAM protein, partial [Clostridiales bacterium]|nr:radical SAM protein [Clostridiales bacterium]
ASLEVLEEVLPYIDAMNIDLKTFDSDIYSKVLGGSLDYVKSFIERACRDSHMEITTLVVPGISDSEDMIRNMASWIASLPGGKDITYHLTRFFPRYKMDDVKATDVGLIYHLADIAGEYLDHVYTGNC